MTPHPDAEPAIVLKPRDHPRDFADVVYCILGMPIGLLVSLAPGVLIGGGLGQLLFHERSLVLLCGLVGTFVVLLAFHGFVVWSLRLDVEGIGFRRLWGRPRFLAWDRISQIRRVEWREALWNELLCPWRSMSPCASMSGTFCVHWDGKRYYFPGRDVAQFRDAVRTFCPRLMSPSAEPPSAVRLLPPAEETGNPYQAPKSGLIDAEE